MSSRANLIPRPVAVTSTRQQEPFALPTVDDAVVMQMRPSLPPAATKVIAADGSGDYKTFSEAISDAENQRSVAMALANVTTPTPYQRIDYLVEPGFYDEQITTHFPPCVAFYAADTTKGNTTLNWGISPDQSPGFFYWEGIDINNPATTFDPKYPVHQAALGTHIYTRCTFNNSGKAGGGGTGIGSDGVDYGTTVLHDVEILIGGTNLHGWASPQKSNPETIVFSNVRCTNTAGGYKLGYASLNDVVADDVWYVNCTAATLEVSGAATNVHVSGTAGTVNHIPSTSGAAMTGTVDTRSDWPIPVGGLSEHDRATYGVAA